MLEHRIMQLEDRLLAARVIDKKEISKDVVIVGAKVRLRDVAAKETVEYRIVGSAEATPRDHKFSNESPVGPRDASARRRARPGVTTPAASP